MCSIASLGHYHCVILDSVFEHQASLQKTKSRMVAIVHSAQHSVQCMQYSVHIIVCTVHIIVCTVHSIVFTVHSIVLTVHSTVCTS